MEKLFILINIPNFLVYVNVFSKWNARNSLIRSVYINFYIEKLTTSISVTNIMQLRYSSDKYHHVLSLYIYIWISNRKHSIDLNMQETLIDRWNTYFPLESHRKKDQYGKDEKNCQVRQKQYFCTTASLLCTSFSWG